MSDWAAKLSQKPAAQSSGTSAQSINSPKPVVTAKTQNVQNHPNQSQNENVQNQNSQNTSKQSKQRSARSSNSGSPHSGSASPEPFNGTEILTWLNKRFSADLEEAHGDKSGDHASVYRSLESSSSWKTKGPSSGRKNAKEEDRYDLLSEINRTSQAKVRRY